MRDILRDKRFKDCIRRRSNGFYILSEEGEILASRIKSKRTAKKMFLDLIYS